MTFHQRLKEPREQVPGVTGTPPDPQDDHAAVRLHQPLWTFRGCVVNEAGPGQDPGSGSSDVHQTCQLKRGGTSRRPTRA